MKAAEYFRPLTKQLLANSNPENAAYMKAYLKDRFELFGLKQQPRRDIFNVFVKENGIPEFAEIGHYLKWLIEQPEREYDYCTIELLLKTKRKWDDSLIEHAQYLITHNSWWDTVDSIATNVIGTYLKKNPQLIMQYVPHWIESDNMWLNRTAMIFQLKYKSDTSTFWLTESILPHLESKEFFHQKAIGWALRQYSRNNPDWVMDFANQYELKPLSRREALRLIV